MSSHNELHARSVIEPPRATARARGGPEGESGTALLVILLILLTISVIGSGMARDAASEAEVVGNYRGMSRAFYAADGMTVATVNEIVQMAGQRGNFPGNDELATITPPTIADVDIEELRIERVGVEVTEPLQSGFYQGLIAVTQDFSIDLTAVTTDWPPGRATVGMNVSVDLIPIFQFAVFYDGDLEIIPGPRMTLSGRVHSNRDIYLNSGDRLRIDSAVTAAGDIFHGRKDDPRAGRGRVEIRASSGWPEMDGLDSNHRDWVDEALTRWNGNVRSSDHGVMPMNLAISDPDNPRMIIEPGLSGDGPAERDSKLFYQADLRIVNGVAYDADGSVVSTVDPVSGDNALRPTIIYDHREQKHMLTVEVDIDKLSRTPAYPANGLIYAGSFAATGGLPGWTAECAGCFGPDEWDGYDAPWSGAATGFAIKVTNAEELPVPTTIVTDNPMYLRGNFNTRNKKGAAVMADAVTVLSRNWGEFPGPPAPDDDLAYSQLPFGNRRPTIPTEINVAIMLGNTTTSVGDYNGGLENVMRFLEDWSGRTFRYRGSLVDLWESLHATGDWRYGSPVYTAPTRDFDFDTDLLDPDNMPPFAPSVFTIRATDWRRE